MNDFFIVSTETAIRQFQTAGEGWEAVWHVSQSICTVFETLKAVLSYRVFLGRLSSPKVLVLVADRVEAQMFEQLIASAGRGHQLRFEKNVVVQLASEFLSELSA